MRLDREATPFLVVQVVLAVAAAVSLPKLAAALILPIAFTLWFFRDPDRTAPIDPGAVTSPADGRVIKAAGARVSIFLNIFDVHVCRTPIGGRVVSVVHIPGRFLAAFKDDASEQNERAEIVVEGDLGQVRFVLVAGLIARRIVCRVRPGEILLPGQRVGIIRFGSRVDLHLPEGVAPVVELRQKVVAGTTVVARR